MERTRIGERFFNSTRGQIVRLLRDSARTVEELSVSLSLTDNAVRAHLATLERDGLVKLEGVRRGPRKPHFTYVLTRAAEDLFPKSYDALLNVILDVLKQKLTSGQVGQVLREAGHKLGKLKSSNVPYDAQFSSRLQEAVALLEDLGGAPRWTIEKDKAVIDSSSCPLAHAVESHSEMCTLAESLIAEVTGAKVREQCDRTQSPPRCSFTVTKGARGSKRLKGPKKLIEGG